MLCNNQPACAGHCSHVALEFPPKNVISQSRDDVEWPQLWIGAQGLHSAKAGLVFWHCLGSVVALQWDWKLKRVFWQPPAALGHSGSSYSTGTGMVGLQKVFLSGVPAASRLSSEESCHLQCCHLGQGPVLGLAAAASCAGCRAGAAGEGSSSRDAFGTRLSISTEQLCWQWEE